MAQVAGPFAHHLSMFPDFDRYDVSFSRQLASFCISGNGDRAGGQHHFVSGRW